jgi:hypothetical protein
LPATCREQQCTEIAGELCHPTGICQGLISVIQGCAFQRLFIQLQIFPSLIHLFGFRRQHLAQRGTVPNNVSFFSVNHPLFNSLRVVSLLQVPWLCPLSPQAHIFVSSFHHYHSREIFFVILVSSIDLSFVTVCSNILSFLWHPVGFSKPFDF